MSAIPAKVAGQMQAKAGTKKSPALAAPIMQSSSGRHRNSPSFEKVLAADQAAPLDLPSISTNRPSHNLTAMKSAQRNTPQQSKSAEISIPSADKSTATVRSAGREQQNTAQLPISVRLALFDTGAGLSLAQPQTPESTETRVAVSPASPTDQASSKSTAVDSRVPGLKERRLLKFRMGKTLSQPLAGVIAQPVRDSGISARTATVEAEPTRNLKLVPARPIPEEIMTGPDRNPPDDGRLPAVEAGNSKGKNTRLANDKSGKSPEYAYATSAINKSESGSRTNPRSAQQRSDSLRFDATEHVKSVDYAPSQNLSSSPNLSTRRLIAKEPVKASENGNVSRSSESDRQVDRPLSQAHVKGDMNSPQVARFAASPEETESTGNRGDLSRSSGNLVAPPLTRRVIAGETRSRNESDHVVSNDHRPVSASSGFIHVESARPRQAQSGYQREPLVQHSATPGDVVTAFLASEPVKPNVLERAKSVGTETRPMSAKLGEMPGSNIKFVSGVVPRPTMAATLRKAGDTHLESALPISRLTNTGDDNSQSNVFAQSSTNTRRNASEMSPTLLMRADRVSSTAPSQRTPDNPLAPPDRRPLVAPPLSLAQPKKSINSETIVAHEPRSPVEVGATKAVDVKHASLSIAQHSMNRGSVPQRALHADPMPESSTTVRANLDSRQMSQAPVAEAINSVKLHAHQPDIEAALQPGITHNFKGTDRTLNLESKLGSHRLNTQSVRTESGAGSQSTASKTAEKSPARVLESGQSVDYDVRGDARIQPLSQSIGEASERSTIAAESSAIQHIRKSELTSHDLAPARIVLDVYDHPRGSDTVRANNSKSDDSVLRRSMPINLNRVDSEAPSRGDTLAQTHRAPALDLASIPRPSMTSKLEPDADAALTTGTQSVERTQSVSSRLSKLRVSTQQTTETVEGHSKNAAARHSIPERPVLTRAETSVVGDRSLRNTREQVIDTAKFDSAPQLAYEANVVKRMSLMPSQVSATPQVPAAVNSERFAQGRSQSPHVVYRGRDADVAIKNATPAVYASDTPHSNNTLGAIAGPTRGANVPSALRVTPVHPVSEVPPTLASFRAPWQIADKIDSSRAQFPVHIESGGARPDPQLGLPFTFAVKQTAPVNVSTGERAGAHSEVPSKAQVTSAAGDQSAVQVERKQSQHAAQPPTPRPDIRRFESVPTTHVPTPNQSSEIALSQIQLSSKIEIAGTQVTKTSPSVHLDTNRINPTTAAVSEPATEVKSRGASQSGSLDQSQYSRSAIESSTGHSSHPLAAPEQVSDRSVGRLDSPTQEITGAPVQLRVDQLQRILQVIDNSLAGIRGALISDHDIQFAWNDHDLGGLHVKIVSSESALRVEITAERGDSAMLLAAERAVIEKMFVEHCVRVDRIDIKSSFEKSAESSMNSPSPNYDKGNPQMQRERASRLPIWTGQNTLHRANVASPHPTTGTIVQHGYGFKRQWIV